jgi:hypothetical protein
MGIFIILFWAHPVPAAQPPDRAFRSNKNAPIPWPIPAGLAVKFVHSANFANQKPVRVFGSVSIFVPLQFLARRRGKPFLRCDI